jgi:hypothetical protein
VVAREPERSVPPRSAPDTSPPASKQRTYGAPISEPPRVSTIALDAPINSPPTTGTIQREKNFSGRTVEASDSAVGSSLAPISNAGTAAAVPAPVAAPARVAARRRRDPGKITPRGRFWPAEVPPKASGFAIVPRHRRERPRRNVAVINDAGGVSMMPPTAVQVVVEPRKENGVAVRAVEGAAGSSEPISPPARIDLLMLSMARLSAASAASCSLG